MRASTDMKIRLESDVSDKLDLVAATTRRSKTDLAEEAIAVYVDHQLSIIEGINGGLADMAGGNMVSHADVMSDLEATIRHAERKHRM